MSTDARSAIEDGRTSLGIELGSTRIKAVLTGPDHAPLASGGYDWENRYVDRIWTYDLETVWKGLQGAYAEVAADVANQYGVTLAQVGGIGVSAMMHGYLAFDEAGELLVPFRTWRNTITGEAADQLTEAFSYNIPQRWSIAHLYQAILNGEEHVGRIAHINTLAGYVHEQLTGRRVLGVGDASGVFPIDAESASYDTERLAKFDALVADRDLPWTLSDLLPASLRAGENAGTLTAEGAKLLDPSGALQPDAPVCPPEGDAGTGMVATNAVAQRTGNVSAGTSIFAMVVLEDALKNVHPEIDLVTTPVGDLVAMVHCNNFTSDLNAWVNLFGEFAREAGLDLEASALYSLLYRKALGGDADGGGLMAFNYLSGEHITHADEGRPLFVRPPDAPLTLANFMRTHLLTSLGALRVGMDILLKDEGVRLDRMFAHGGFFKTEGVGQRLLAAGIETPVSVGSTAGEGGAWGMALLAAYRRDVAAEATREALGDYLAHNVFAAADVSTLDPQPEDVAGFDAFMARYRRALPLEQAAVEAVPLRGGGAA